MVEKNHELFFPTINIMNLYSKTFEKSYVKVLARYKSAPDMGLAVEAFKLCAYNNL